MIIVCLLLKVFERCQSAFTRLNFIKDDKRATFCYLRIVHGGDCGNNSLGIEIALKYGVQIHRVFKVAIDGTCVILFAEGKHGVCFSDLPCSVDEERFAVCRVFPFDKPLLDEPFHDVTSLYATSIADY